MQTNPFISNQKGSALLAALIGGTALSITLMAFSKMHRANIIISRELSSKSEQLTLIDSVRLVLGDPKRCASTLYDRTDREQRAQFNPNPESGTDYKLGSIRLGAKSIAEVGVSTGYDLLSELRLSELDPAGTEDLGTKMRYVTSLELVSQRLGPSQSAEFRTKKLTLSVTTQKEATTELPKDAIVACSLVPEGESLTSTGNELHVTSGSYTADCPNQTPSWPFDAALEACSKIQTIDLPGKPIFVQVNSRPALGSAAQRYFKLDTTLGGNWVGTEADWEAYHAQAFPVQFPYFPQIAAFRISIDWAYSGWVTYYRPYIQFVGNAFKLRGATNGDPYSNSQQPGKAVFDYIAYYE